MTVFLWGVAVADPLLGGPGPVAKVGLDHEWFAPVLLQLVLKQDKKFVISENLKNKVMCSHIHSNIPINVKRISFY